MRHETPTSLRIQKARTALLLDHPFFGSLLFRLKGRECRSVKRWPPMECRSTTTLSLLKP